MPGKVVWVPGSTRKLCQFTGEIDQQSKRPTLNQTETRVGLRGTDLGASFEHGGRVCFLFGDTHPSGPNTQDRPIDGDSIAFSSATNGDGDVRLDFVRALDGRYATIQAPGLSIAGFEIPTGGVSVGGRMYVFFATDARIEPGRGATMTRSVLLRSDDDGKSFASVYTVSRDKIVYVTPVSVTQELWSGLSEKRGRGLLLFAGTREYRRGNLHLAHVSQERIEDASALRYFAGTGAGNVPQWSAREGEARPLFDHPYIGENCVTYNRFLKQWLVLYNSVTPRGIVYRSADKPWGPWSDAQLLFEPRRDNGYGAFMHDVGRVPDDGLSEPGREREYGGEYGPYVVERFTRGKAGETTLYFVMSTWNPYNTVLMKTTLRVA